MFGLHRSVKTARATAGRGLASMRGDATQRGHVDVADNYAVMGWATSAERDPELVDVLVDGVPVATLRAALYRRDLEDAGIGDGRHGFRYRFEDAIALMDDATIEVRHHFTGESVRPGPIHVPGALSGESRFRPALGQPFATVLSGTRSRDGAVLRCAATVISVSRPVSARCHQPGIRVVDFACPPIEEQLQPHPDWSWSTAKAYRVTFVLEIPATTDAPAALVEFETAQPLDDQGARRSLLPLTLCVALREDWHTVPQIGNMTRVAGHAVDVDLYVNGGVQTAHKLDRMVAAYLEHGDAARFLDWGAGSARVAVPLKRLFRKDARVVGVDVDEVNVGWARGQLPDVPMSISPLYPPLSFPDDSFDVVYGISVMTHLPQAAQQVWLRELRRVLRPGGLCILTTHGDHFILGAPRTAQVVREIATYGISDHIRDDVIAVSEPGFYRSTFQLREQVLKTWATVMPVVAYLPCANQLQDVVVMRRD